MMTSISNTVRGSNLGRRRPWRMTTTVRQRNRESITQALNRENADTLRQVNLVGVAMS